MTARIRLFKNVSALLVRELFNKGALALVIILVGRILGQEGLGQYTLCLNLSNMLFLLTDFGLGILLIREVAADSSKGPKYLFHFGILRAVLGALSVVLVLALGWALGVRGPFAGVLALCAISYYVVNLLTLLEAGLRAVEKMEYTAYVTVPKSLAYLALGWALLNAGFGLLSLFVAFFGVNLLAVLGAWRLVLREVASPEGPWDWGFVKRCFQEAVPFWLFLVFVEVYFYIDSLMIFAWCGEADLGVYSAAYLFMVAVRVGAGAFVGALFPTLSRRYQTDRKSFERAYVQSFRLMAVIGAPVCAGVTLFASQLVRLAFGEGFEASAWVLQLLAWAGLLVAFGNLNGSVLYAAGRQKVMAVVCGLGLILNIGLNIWLIPPYTYMGAAFATLVTELLVWLSLMGYLRYRLGLDTHQLWGMPDLKYLKSEEKTHGD